MERTGEMATTEEMFDELNQIITDNYDIIWQEAWYGFYDKAKAACVDASGYVTGEVGAHVHWLEKYLDEAGDAPSQEQWFSICGEIYGLEEELGRAGAIEPEFFVKWARLLQ